MTRHSSRRTRNRRPIACRAMAVLLLLSVKAAARPVPQVDAGLDEFRHGRYAEALANWEQAARAGDARGALYAGVMYDSGVGVRRDFREAMELYHQAADGGSAVAAFNLGVMYDGGFGVESDQARAAQWYERAAAAGFGRAEYNLAMLYDLGAGVPQDRARAVELYRSAAAQGISAATEHLAALREPAVAARKPRTAPTREPAEDVAMHDFQSAQRVLLSRGAGDASRAARLFRRAAERHNAVAEYDLGYCYEHGLGVAADTAAAARWYHRAASDSADESLRSMAQQSAATVEGATTTQPTN